jgi:cell wall-associated NlpC family hydrolase
MVDTAIATSQTSPRDITTGTTCTVGRLMSEQEGWQVVNAAEGWEGTPYRAVGANSVKRLQGDCSGTTNKIFIEAGFPYPYKRTANFIDYVENSHRFREIHQDREPLQAGDVLFWSGHMAIYAPFPEGHPKRNTGVMHRGKAVPNNFYTAFNERTGAPYAPYNIATFRGDAYRVFRYFLLPGEDKCKA